MKELKWQIPDHNLEVDEEELESNECSCGSGEQPEEVYDARGIYLTKVCSKCREEKLSHYRKDVLEDPEYWHDEPIDEDK
jgi:hypothetical protein